MLTLAGNLRVDRFAVYRDVIRRNDAWINTSTFYVVPDAPELARDADGLPLFDFLWYRTAADATSDARTPAAGGILTITVTLAPRADEFEIVREHLDAIARQEGLTNIEIRSLPITRGMVALAFAGETGDADFTNAVAGSGPV